MLLNSKYFLLAIVLMVATACSDEDDDSTMPDPATLPITSEEITGTWRIAFFQDDREDVTQDFDGLTLEFEDDGNLIISDGDKSTTARWSIANNDTQLRMEISANNEQVFSEREELDDLSDAWNIAEKSDTAIRLQEDDDDSERDEVRFERL